MYHFRTDFDVHPYTGNVFFARFFSFFFDLKIARDDSGLLYRNGDFGQTRLSIKKRVFSLHVEPCDRKDTEERVHFHCFFEMKHANFEKVKNDVCVELCSGYT